MKERLKQLFIREYKPLDIPKIRALDLRIKAIDIFTKPIIAKDPILPVVDEDERPYKRKGGW